MASRYKPKLLVFNSFQLVKLTVKALDLLFLDLK